MEAIVKSKVWIFVILIGCTIGVLSAYRPIPTLMGLSALFVWFVLVRKHSRSMFFLIPVFVISFIPSDFVAINVSTPLGDVKFSIIIITLLLVWGILFKFNRQSMTLISKHTGLLVTLLLLFGVNLISAMVNQSSLNQMILSINIFILSFGVLLHVLLSSKINTLKVLKISLYVSTMVSILGIIEFFGIQPFLKVYTLGGQSFFYNNTLYEGLPRIVSTLGNPLVLSIYLLLFFPFTIYLRESEVKKMKWNVIMILHLLGIMLTMSRSAILIVVILLLFTFMKINFKSLIKVGAVLGIFSLFFYLIVTFMSLNQLISDRLLFKTQTESYTYRFESFGAIMNILNSGNEFVGMGLGNVNSFLKSYGGTLVSHNTMDNIFLDTLASSGIIGLCLLLIMLLSLYFKFRVMEKNLRLVGFSMLIIFIGMGFSFDLMHYEAVWGVFWFLSGLLIVHSWKTKEAKAINQT